MTLGHNILGLKKTYEKQCLHQKNLSLFSLFFVVEILFLDIFFSFSQAFDKHNKKKHFVEKIEYFVFVNRKIDTV